MSEPTGHRRLRRGIVTLVGVAGLIGTAGLASAGMAGDQSSQFVHSLRSIADILGITFSLTVVYYAYRARKQFDVGVFGTAATYTMIGALLFALGFLQMELLNGFGIDLFAFAPGMQSKMAIRMVLFTGSVFAFGWAFYRMGKALEGV